MKYITTITFFTILITGAQMLPVSEADVHAHIRFLNSNAGIVDEKYSAKIIVDACKNITEDRLRFPLYVFIHNVKSVDEHDSHKNNILKEIHAQGLVLDKQYCGTTPLIEAIRSNDTALVPFLLENGAQNSINDQDKNGDTALHNAVHANRSIIKTLIEHGADITIVNNEGETAYDVAKQEIKFYKSVQSKDVQKMNKAAQAMKELQDVIQPLELPSSTQKNAISFSTVSSAQKIAITLTTIVAICGIWYLCKKYQKKYDDKKKEENMQQFNALSAACKKS